MKLNLDKNDLMSLAKGTYPNYSVMGNPLIKKQGTYDGSQDCWRWNYSAFETCTEEEILEIYTLCKNSWV